MFWNKVSIILVICCLGVYGESRLTEDERMLELCQGIEPNNFIADPTDEQKYILCTSTNAYPQICDSGKCFDANSKSSPCSTCLPTDTTLYCQRNDETWLELVPHADCNKYSICLGATSQPITENCPANQHFSPKEHKCMRPYEADCSLPSKWCQNKANGVRYAAGSCSKYYECFNRETILKSCLYYEYFDEQSNECLRGSCLNEDVVSDGQPTCTTNDEGVYKTHPKCYKFYFCANKVAYEGQCPSGYYFNVNQKTCLQDNLNTCTDN